MRAVIPVSNGDTLGAVRDFLRALITEEVVDAVLVPMETTDGAVAPALVADPDLLKAANPLAPVLGLNAAPVVGHVSLRTPRARIGVVLRSCEMRALVELVKLRQADLADLVTIGVDCLGTYDVPVYNALRDSKGGGALDSDALLASAETGDLAPQEGYAFRDGCQMCEKPHAEGTDITLELFGADLRVGIPVSLPDDVAVRLGLVAAALDSGEEHGRRVQVVERLVRARTQVRDARFAEILARLADRRLGGIFASCVRCHNCMTVCPICCCRTCLFRTPTFEHEPMQYVSWAERKGACRLPADTLLFHLTRLNHMALSCVGCGVCTSSCPVQLPVGSVFRAIGHRLQGTFDYVPGRDTEEPLPMVTFREDEWSEIGEE